MASRKKANTKRVKMRRRRAAPLGYKIEAGVAKPAHSVVIGKTPERLTLERLRVGQSFALADRSKRKRVRDICYRLKKSTGKVFSLISTEKETRIWRDK